MLDTTNKLAVVTGASTGIGLELARICAKNSFSLIIAANEPEIEDAANELRERAPSSRLSRQIWPPSRATKSCI